MESERVVHDWAIFTSLHFTLMSKSEKGIVKKKLLQSNFSHEWKFKNSSYNTSKLNASDQCIPRIWVQNQVLLLEGKIDLMFENHAM